MLGVYVQKTYNCQQLPPTDKEESENYIDSKKNILRLLKINATTRENSVNKKEILAKFILTKNRNIRPN